MPSPTVTEKAGFADDLIAWYEANGRDLPWRNTKDPYAIWLSEVMLQQTQVNTVLPYYEKFLRLFPTVQALADAPADTVLKAWEGLGYYSRCRNLQKAAQVIAFERGGQFPDTLEGMLALPGIGRYTAGAVLTFAFGQRQPILDGNVKRVLARIYNLDDDPAVLESTLWKHSEALLAQAADPYPFNQGLMELGATTCLPQNPRCMLCPVQAHCEAFAAGTQHELPRKAVKKATPHHHIAVGVIWHEDKMLIQQRPAEGLLGGLWEFPGGKQESGEVLEATVTREITEELGIEVTVGEKIATVKHAYTHFIITLHAYHCQYVSGTPEPKAAQGWRWVTLEELSDYAFPKANKVVLEALQREALEKG